ncbi:Oidioi.mRNA.OKI2018_I69.chr2.g4174.t1.cds [Oikopleura dioica]|uniref:Oidioi.mRNA.OKI2018_I69.chr2.g4174.t1.cds n=1 Tax=Oikopleura dioica TaxID=34765 RepID=A0ABN7SWG4_OIKDI|nr:Oidioi.mRNA.OKI2018_I69.chr2.g4174.t1.cds [Oikopleura dioica]
MPGKTLLFHWRYDKWDYLNNPGVHDKKNSSMKFIDQIRNDPRLLAKRLSMISEENAIEYIYFASPRNDWPFIKKITAGLRGVEFVKASSLETFVKKTVFSCPDFCGNFDDYFSQIEQELARLSDIFIYSCFSSWSSNVLIDRLIDGKNENYNNIQIIAEINEENYSSSCLPFFHSSKKKLQN